MIKKNKKEKEFYEKIEWKFYSYFVQYQLAKYDDDIMGQEVNTDHNAESFLSDLKIDRQAREKKEALIKASAQYKFSVSNEISNKVAEKVEELVKNEHLIKQKILDFPEIILVLLDKLYLKSSSFKDLEFLISNSSWLERMILDTIKQPFFSNQLSGRTQQTRTLRTAIGLIGESNLKLIVPKYICQHNIPKDSSFPLVGRKIYEHSIMTATAAYHLTSKFYPKLNPSIAYTAAIFHEIGTIMLFKLYLEVFDEIWKEELKNARENIDQKRFNAISKIEPSQKHMRKMFYENSRSFSKNIIQDLKFDRLPVQKILLRFCDRTILNENNEEDFISSYVSILEKANLYAEAQELFNVKLINKKHKDFLAQSIGLSEKELEVLNSKNLKSSPLFKMGAVV